jgi:hypothetical protein
MSHPVCYLKSAFKPQGIEWFLDGFAEGFKLRGWLVPPEELTEGLFVLGCGGKRLAVPRGIRRARLAELFPERTGAEYGGFEVDLEAFADADVRLYWETQKENHLLATLFPKSRKTILFLHIPKTAGTTVNEFFRKQFGDEHCLIHVETKEGWVQKASHECHDFISGHVIYRTLEKSFELGKYSLAVTLRNPLDHFISHISWVRHLCEPGEEKIFANHPEWIQQFSLRMKGIDLSSTEGLSMLINLFGQRELFLFDNCQTRYLSSIMNPPRVTDEVFHSAKRNLLTFDYIGLDHSIESFLEGISRDYGLSGRQETRSRKNVLNNRYGIDRNDPAVRDALGGMVGYDQRLYDFARLLRANRHIMGPIPTPQTETMLRLRACSPVAESVEPVLAETKMDPAPVRFLCGLFYRDIDTALSQYLFKSAQKEPVLE